MKWGMPTYTYPLPNGGKIIEYVNNRNVQIGGYTETVPETTYNSGTVDMYGNNGNSASGSYSGTSTQYVQRTTPIQNISLRCVTRFTVDAYGMITKWAWQGNACKAR